MKTWKNISDFPYKVSESGEVRRLDTDKPLKPYLSNGYFKIDLYRNSKRKKEYLHRLIAIHFCKGYFLGATVNHKDGNRQNNSLDNLEWVTHAENLKHSYDCLGRKSPKPKGSNSIHAKAVIQISLSGKKIKKYGSIVEAISEHGQCVERVLYGRNKTAYGFKWAYAD